jgi:hypothetical protein
MREKWLKRTLLGVVLALAAFSLYVEARTMPSMEPDLEVFQGDIVSGSNRYSQMDDPTPRDDEHNIETSSTGIETDFRVSLTDDDVFVDANDFVELYFDADRLIFKVRTIASGYVWASSFREISPENSDAVGYRLTSPVWIEYFPYNETTGKLSETAIEHNVNGSIKATGQPRRPMASVDSYVEQGVVTLWIDFLIAGITFPLQISLDEQGLQAFVPTAQIEEGNNLLASITLFPTFGATVSDNIPGYVVIPDGPGALYRFKDNAGSLQVMMNERYYGTNLGLKNNTNESMSVLSVPIFGIVHGHRQDAMYVAIEEGSTNAAFLFNPSGASNVNYNYAANKFVFRESFVTPTSLATQNEGGGVIAIETVRHDENIRVHYRFLEGDDATAIGIANHYREELTTQGVLTPRTDLSGILLEYVLVETTQGLFGPSRFAVSTFETVEASVRDLLNQGVPIRSVVLKGWAKGGLSGNAPYPTSFDPLAGSNAQFERLNTMLTSHGIECVLHTEYGQTGVMEGMRPSGDAYAQGLHRMTIRRDQSSPVYPTTIYLNPVSARAHFADDLPWLEELGIDGLAFSSVGNTLFTFLHQGETYSRADHAREINALLSASTSFKTFVERPNSYLWGNVDTYQSMPVFHSQYTLYDDTVPFLSTILRTSMTLAGHAYNASTNLTELNLLWIDHGIEPTYVLSTHSTYRLKFSNSWNLSSTSPSTWTPSMLYWQNRYLQGMDRTAHLALVDRFVPMQGFVENVYQDGTRVYINFTDVPKEYAGQTIPAKSAVWTVN